MDPAMQGSRPTISSRHGMVAAAHPLAAQAGARLLASGGNAFDAAAATAAALNVVEPFMSSLAGQGLATMWVAAERRVRVLEEAGVIVGYSALVDREKAGFTTSAILHVSLERHDAKFVDEFVSRVTARAEVLECFATTGDADYHLRVVVRDMQAYNAFLDEFMFRLPGIRHVRTNVILKEIKTSVALPF